MKLEKSDKRKDIKMSLDAELKITFAFFFIQARTEAGNKSLEIASTGEKTRLGATKAEER